MGSAGGRGKGDACSVNGGRGGKTSVQTLNSFKRAWPVS